MVKFGKKDENWRCTSVCGKYFIQRARVDDAQSWVAGKLDGGGAVVFARNLDMENAIYACEDDFYRYPCGCTLMVRPDWWVHCPRCGAKLPEPKPYVPPPPKPERKKKVPNRPEWLKKYTAGYEGGQDWDCMYDGKNWAVVRIPGRTGWVSIGSQAYHPTSFEVVRKSDPRQGMHAGLKETAGLTDLRKVPRFIDNTARFTRFDVHEGRATKADLARFQGMVDILDKAGL